MNDRRTTTSQHMVAHEYIDLLCRLGVAAKPGSIVLLVECTRCGGGHALSECRWPVVEK